MKTNRHLLKIISVLLSVILLCSGLLINISAETEKVKVLISSKEYLSDQQIYSSQDKFSSGETVYLSVAISRVYGLGGLSFTVKYNSDALEFKKNAAVCLIEDKDSSVTYNDKDSIVTVAYYTGAYNTSSSTTGEIFLLPFLVKNLSSNATCNFSLEVKALYDNTSWQNDIEFDDEGAECTISAISEGIPSDLIEAAAKLENIEYNETSKSNIDNALDLFSKLSAQQQSLFKTMYPSHYEWLTTAKERYNREAEKAEKDKVLSEVNGFKEAHASALKLTVDTVKISDQAAVEAALKAYENCSDVAKNHLMNENDLIKALSEKVEELIEIKGEINDFLTDSNFSVVWNESYIEQNIEYAFADYAKFFELALVRYAMLSSGVKAELTEEYEYLNKMKKIIDEYLEKDEEAQELAAKVADFMQAYMHVFTRNENNVSIEDKAAINMVIQAYDRLEDLELKEELKDRISKLELLLDVIDESELEDDEDSDNQPSGNLDNSSNSNNTSGKGESIVQKVTKVINNITNSGSRYSNTILYLFVLLGVSLLLLMLAYILGEKHKKFMDNVFYNGEEVEVAE